MTPETERYEVWSEWLFGAGAALLLVAGTGLALSTLAPDGWATRVTLVVAKGAAWLGFSLGAAAQIAKRIERRALGGP